MKNLSSENLRFHQHFNENAASIEMFAWLLWWINCVYLVKKNTMGHIFISDMPMINETNSIILYIERLFHTPFVKLTSFIYFGRTLALLKIQQCVTCIPCTNALNKSFSCIKTNWRYREVKVFTGGTETCILTQNLDIFVYSIPLYLDLLVLVK